MRPASTARAKKSRTRGCVSSCASSERWLSSTAAGMAAPQLEDVTVWPAMHPTCSLTSRLSAMRAVSIIIPRPARSRLARAAPRNVSSGTTQRVFGRPSAMRHVLGRYPDAGRVFGHHSDIPGVFGRKIATSCALNVQISPENTLSVQLLPENARGLRISPEKP